MPNLIFDSYNYLSYINWHNEIMPTDSPLDSNLDQLINDLKLHSEMKFEEISQILTGIASYSEFECRCQTRGFLDGKFIIPLQDFSKNSPGYTHLFKSRESIVDKLWRKNKYLSENNYINLSNIKLNITDLVRTSVIAPTLFHAKFFAERLSKWNEILPPEQRELCPSVLSINVDSEAKLASGYFAYHSLIKFRDESCIEVQIYSQLTSAWRHLAHKMYEKTRLGDSSLIEPGSPSSRLVSLGHLLHLAEWEIERLQEQFRNDAR